MTKIVSQNNRIRLFPRQQSSITIERLDFDGLESFSVIDNIAEVTGDYGLVLISRSAFRNAHAGLRVSVLRHNVRVKNSLFINNNRAGSSTGLFVETAFNSNTGQDATANVVNCTLRGNGVGAWIGSWVAGPNLTASSIVNTISTGNIVDVILARPTQIRHSMYSTLSTSDAGALAAGSIRNSTANPLLDANHRPGLNSRAIDSGDSAAVQVLVSPPLALTVFGIAYKTRSVPSLNCSVKVKTPLLKAMTECALPSASDHKRLPFRLASVKLNSE